MPEFDPPPVTEHGLLQYERAQWFEENKDVLFNRAVFYYHLLVESGRINTEKNNGQFIAIGVYPEPEEPYSIEFAIAKGEYDAIEAFVDKYPDGLFWTLPVTKEPMRPAPVLPLTRPIPVP